ncbi:MAG: mannose/fructose/sorbose PTS transporter subunit IIB [Enterobacteriaceae bacterium]
MNIAAIISTHGNLAKSLLETVEVILGRQENVSCVHLMPNNSIGNLLKKYYDCLNILDKENGLLFFVDIWGGSPFNSAIQVIGKDISYNVISGVNIPMLIEFFTSDRSKKMNDIFIENIIKSGVKNIKSFRQTNFNLDKKKMLNNIKKRKKKLMDITFVRIDDRLVHGQIITCWLKHIKVNRIIIISDNVYEDEIRKNMLSKISPVGVSVHVLNIDKSIRVYNNVKYSDDKVMLIFENPTDVLRVVKKGISINYINIGGMSFKEGKKQISDSVSLDKNDIKSLKELNSRGIKLEIQKVPTDKSLNIIDLI